MVINNGTTIDPELLSRLEKELAALDYTVPEKTQTIKDILKDKKTSCWGISRIALERLKRAGLDPETVYVAEDDDDMRPTHQFTTYRDGDKYRIFDHWVTRQLLDELYPSREAAIDAGVENWRREGHPHSIRAYTGTYIPKPGKDFEEYMDAMEKGNKLLKKYPALEKSGSVYDLPEIQRLEKELSTLDYDWDDPYKTQTIKDILKSRKDHCWGVARLIRNRLRRAQLDPEVVYMKEEEHDGVTPTHQFNTYKDGDDYRVLDYRVDNHSMIPFYGPRGKTREEAILKYLDAWRKEQNSFTGNVDIWTGNYIPKPGKDWYEYMDAIESRNKHLQKYPALEKKAQKEPKINSELFAEYMAYLINNNKAPKQVKQAGLDNYWMSLNPETNKYEDAPLEGIKSDNYGSIDPYWFRGKAYGDLVEAISNGSLYGMSHAPREYYDDDDEYESAQEYDWDSYNWLTNEQCKQIYNRLKKLNPRKLRKLRKRFEGLYYIPEDEDAQAFIDQFGKHTDAGHSLLASW